MDKVAVTELGYVGIGVRDMGAWRGLAGEILGMEVPDGSAPLRVRMDYWCNRIILHEDPRDDLLFAGLRVAGPDEFILMQKQLMEAGVKFEVASAEEASERCVLEYLRLRDPADVPLEIFHGPQVDRAKPFRPGRGMHGKFRTGAAGMGHIIVRDAGSDLSYRFYRDVLGMRGSIEQKIRIGDSITEIVFMHCNERDHTIAFGTGAQQKHIHHLMIEVDNIDDVGMAYDMVRKTNMPIRISLGRHSNDNAISFYFETPSGWFIEYGCAVAPAVHQSEFSVGEIWGHELSL